MPGAEQATQAGIAQPRRELLGGTVEVLHVVLPHDHQRGRVQGSQHLCPALQRVLGLLEAGIEGSLHFERTPQHLGYPSAQLSGTLGKHPRIEGRPYRAVEIVVLECRLIRLGSGTQTLRGLEAGRRARDQRQR